MAQTQAVSAAIVAISAALQAGVREAATLERLLRAAASVSGVAALAVVPAPESPLPQASIGPKIDPSALRLDSDSETPVIFLGPSSGLAWALAAPIEQRNQVIGWLVAGHTSGAPSELQTAYLSSLAHLLAMAGSVPVPAEQLAHLERLASIGQMTAGIVHELNNPINFIFGNISYLEDYLNDIEDLLEVYRGLTSLSPEEQKQVKEAEKETDIDFVLEDLHSVLKSLRKGAERARDIITDMRSFARSDAAEMSNADINEILESALTILTNKLKYGVTTHKDFSELPTVRCHPGRVNQVFVNLISNAADAMDGKGELWLTTRKEGSHVVVTVKDSGTGIPPEVMKRLFTPFFTTKPGEKGTGLGLSLSKDIVERQHGGTITVESTPGQGATFIVKLPIAGPAR